MQIMLPTGDPVVLEPGAARSDAVPENNGQAKSLGRTGAM